MVMPEKKKGRRFVACAPGTSPVSIRLCSGEHDRCTCRGQRRPAACHDHRHAVGKGKHTHSKDGRGVLLLHDCCPLLCSRKILKCMIDVLFTNYTCNRCGLSSL